MTDPSLTRDEIIARLKAAFEPLDFVYAMWEGGAAAFGRVDCWSDIDVQVDVDDNAVPETVAILDQTLTSLSPITQRYEIPQPAWHGHAQTFYRLHNTSPFLLVDFCAIRHSNPLKFLEPEIHGQAIVHFDKCGVTRTAPLDPSALRERLKKKLPAMSVRFEMFQALVEKELNRGNALEALAFYQSMTLRPLVDVLRMRYSPWHHDFYLRYVYYELPAEITQRLEALAFVSRPDDLRQNLALAADWFHEASEALESEL